MSRHLFDIEIRAHLPDFAIDYRLQTDATDVGIIGPSGAGKTTIAELLAGWRTPHSGRVSVGGRLLYDSAAGVSLPPRARGVGYVAQDSLLFPHLSVIDNIRSGSRRGSTTDEHTSRFERTVDALELAPLLDRSVTMLSGGERRRVALARALASHPQLLILDEPLASLDPALRRRILSHLVRVRDTFQIPMLVVSHDPHEVAVLCRWAQTIERGRVAVEGAPTTTYAMSQPTVAAAARLSVIPGRVVDAGDEIATIAVDGGPPLRVPRQGLAAGERVYLGIRADDVLVATAPVRGLSARNVVGGRIVRLDVQDDATVVFVALDGGTRDRGAEIAVDLTAEAVRELSLGLDMRVQLILKARSITVLANVDDVS